MLNPDARGEPASNNDTALIADFNKEVIKQGERLDDLAKELFKLEMWIPGLYMTVLNLARVIPQVSLWFVGAALVCWVLSITINVYSIFPKQYSVQRDIPMSIESFYQQSAQSKYWSLVGATIFFFLGIIFAVLSVTTP